MNRREFIGGGLSAATYALLGSIRAEAASGVSVDGHALPSWAVDQIEEAVARYEAWKGRDTVVSFPIMTDCHSPYWGFSRLNVVGHKDRAKATAENLNLEFKGGPFWHDKKTHILFMRHLAHRCGSDFVADLGDHDFEFGPFGEAFAIDKVRLGMTAYRKLYERETLPTIFTHGNHDSSRGRIGDAEYGELLNRSLNAGKKMDWKLSADGTFGCLDLPAKKFRVVFLNSTRNNVLGLDAEQLQFMADAFASAPADWHVIEMEHIPVMIMHNWRRSMASGVDRNMRLAYAIMDSYANRRGDFVQGWAPNTPKNVWKLGGGQGSVTFRFADVKSHFAGAFFGHQHVTDFIHYGHVPLVTRPGMGTLPRDCMAGEMHDVKNHNPQGMPPNTTLLDLVAIKPSHREVRVFRCGLGGAAEDLAYAY